MTDYFKVLNEPRRPWLDAEPLKARFLALSSEVHPDRFHNSPETEKLVANQRYLDLNSAFNCLRDHKERLLHLLELETGARPANSQRIPAELMDMFMAVGQTCKSADLFLAEKDKVNSPLAKVQLFEKGMEWTDQLTALQTKINGHQGALVDRLRALDSAWMLQSGEVGRGELCARMEQLYREFGYVNRWTSQVQERIVQLSF